MIIRFQYWRQRRHFDPAVPYMTLAILRKFEADIEDHLADPHCLCPRWMVKAERGRLALIKENIAKEYERREGGTT